MVDEMRTSTACFARAPQRCTNRLSKHLLLTFQEVTLLSKTRNQLMLFFENLIRALLMFKGLRAAMAGGITCISLPKSLP